MSATEIAEVEVGTTIEGDNVYVAFPDFQDYAQFTPGEAVQLSRALVKAAAEALGVQV